MSEAKVVELNTERRRVPALPPLVQTIRQSVKKNLQALVQGLFDNTDDALFELADRSQSDQHQEMYFDSMRLIRLHRDPLGQVFMNRVGEGFARLCEDEPVTHTDLSLDDGAEGYTLLDQDELEMSVAVSGIVSSTVFRSCS